MAYSNGSMYRLIVFAELRPYGPPYGSWGSTWPKRVWQNGISIGSAVSAELTVANPLMHKVAEMVTYNNGVRRHTGLTHGF